MNAHEINDLFEQESPAGRLYVRLKEMGVPVEREWLMDEEGTGYIVDLVSVTFGDRTGPASGLRFCAEVEPGACVRDIRARLTGS